jgi:hypothetical protein
MKKYILIKKFSPQLQEEHKSIWNCEKFQVILKVFVNIAFHLQFFTSIFYLIFPQISWLVLYDTLEIDLCLISAQTLTTDRKKQDFFFIPIKYWNVIALNLILIPIFDNFFPGLCSLIDNGSIWRKNLVLCAQILTNERKNQAYIL